MSLATTAAIIDRVLSVIEGLTPTSLAADKFRRYRAEMSGNFEEWVGNNPNCLRRVAAREVIGDQRPETSSGVEERTRTTIRVTIAYPQTHRYGADNTRDRDDVIAQDWKLINAAIGIYGRANFSSTNDCTPLGCTPARESSGSADLYVIDCEIEYQRSIA